MNRWLSSFIAVCMILVAAGVNAETVTTITSTQVSTTASPNKIPRALENGQIDASWGIQGIQGPPGPSGPTGPAGPQGVQGPAGPALNWRDNWEVGQTYSADNFDAIYYGGSSYRCTQTHVADSSNRPKSPAELDAGAVDVNWILMARQGLPGPQGIQGIQGLKGDKGDKGDQGIQGPQGPLGPPGPQGIQGIQGTKGDTGATGATGPQGPIGPKGDTGPAGSAGQGIAVGGAQGDVLVKTGTADYATGWTKLGSASTKDVPDAGNATATQVVLGSDLRLADKRDPNTHAPTHATGSTDPITPAAIGAVATSSVVNNLTSGGTTVPLSAEQGKTLKGLIDGQAAGAAAGATALQPANVVNNLTAGGTMVPLSAEQGKVLQTNKADKATDLAGYGITNAVSKDDPRLANEVFLSDFGDPTLGTTVQAAIDAVYASGGGTIVLDLPDGNETLLVSETIHLKSYVILDGQDTVMFKWIKGTPAPMFDTLTTGAGQFGTIRTGVIDAYYDPGFSITTGSNFLFDLHSTTYSDFTGYIVSANHNMTVVYERADAISDGDHGGYVRNTASNHFGLQMIASSKSGTGWSPVALNGFIFEGNHDLNSAVTNNIYDDSYLYVAGVGVTAKTLCDTNDFKGYTLITLGATDVPPSAKTTTGTISVAGDTVTGVGTQFTTVDWSQYKLTVTTSFGSETEAVETVTSDTTVKVRHGFAGTVAGATWSLTPMTCGATGVVLGSVHPGVVSVSGNSITGIGTYFTHNIWNTNKIVVTTSAGKETRTISAVNNDTSLTVSEAFAGTATNTPNYSYEQGVYEINFDKLNVDNHWYPTCTNQQGVVLNYSGGTNIGVLFNDAPSNWGDSGKNMLVDNYATSYSVKWSQAPSGDQITRDEIKGNLAIAGSGNTIMFPDSSSMKGVVTVVGTPGVNDKVPSEKAVRDAISEAILDGGNPIALQTNGIVNSTQTTLNLVGGTNVTLSETGGAVTINASGGPGGGGDVTAPVTNSDNYVPQWSGANTKTLKNGLPVNAYPALSTLLATDSNGAAGIKGGSFTPTFTLQNDNSNSGGDRFPQFTVRNFYGATNGFPALTLYNNGGTGGSPISTASGKILGGIWAGGYHTDTAVSPAGEITTGAVAFVSTGAISGADQPTAMKVDVGKVGGNGVLNTKLYVDSNGVSGGASSGGSLNLLSNVSGAVKGYINFDDKAHYDGTYGKLLLTNNSSITTTNTMYSKITLIGENSTPSDDATISQEMFSTNAFPTVQQRRGRGTFAAPVKVSSGDRLGGIAGRGYYGVNGSGGQMAGSGTAGVFFDAEDTFDDATHLGSRIAFETAAPATGAKTEKMRLYGNGGLQLGGTYGTSPGAGNLSVAGAVTAQKVIENANSATSASVSGAVAADCTSYTVNAYTLTGATTITMPTSLSAGVHTCTFAVTGAQNLAFAASPPVVMVGATLQQPVDIKETWYTCTTRNQGTKWSCWNSGVEQ